MLTIKNILSGEELSELWALLDKAEYVPGTNTSGIAGQSIKNNVQVRASGSEYTRANDIVRNAIVRSEELQLYASPHIVTPARFSRYGPGMHYGRHFDAAVMPLPNSLLRADLSFTLFLNDPDQYVGGALVVDFDGLRHEVRGEAGDMFIYPSGMPHEVTEVVTGSRQVAIGWIQSVFASHEHRRIIQRLKAARYALLQDTGRNETYDMIDEAVVRLERMWAQT